MADHRSEAAQLLYKTYANSKGAQIDAPEKRALDIEAAKAHIGVALLDRLDTLIGLLMPKQNGGGW